MPCAEVQEQATMLNRKRKQRGRDEATEATKRLQTRERDSGRSCPWHLTKIETEKALAQELQETRKALAEKSVACAKLEKQVAELTGEGAPFKRNSITTRAIPSAVSRQGVVQGRVSSDSPSQARVASVFSVPLPAAELVGPMPTLLCCPGSSSGTTSPQPRSLPPPPPGVTLPPLNTSFYALQPFWEGRGHRPLPALPHWWWRGTLPEAGGRATFTRGGESSPPDARPPSAIAAVSRE